MSYENVRPLLMVLGYAAAGFFALRTALSFLEWWLGCGYVYRFEVDGVAHEVRFRTHDELKAHLRELGR